jgi:hypothetical protein
MRSNRPPTSRLAPAVVALVLVVSLGGCFLDPGACSYEHRTLVLRGSVVGWSGIEVSLNETRGSNPDFRVLNLQATSGDAAGTVSSAQLRDISTTPAQVLAEWTTGSASSALWSANLDLPGASPSHEMLATLARAGRLQVAILVGRAEPTDEHTGLLAVATDGDWNHPRCD